MAGIHNPADMAATLAAIEVNRLLLAVISAQVADVDADIVIVQAHVDDIQAVTDALPTLTTAIGSTTTTTIDTEYAMYINNAPLGVYKPILMKLWMLNQTATETVVIRTYYRLADGGVWVGEDTLTVEGLPDEGFLNVPLTPTRWGVRVTIERTAGTSRAYPWEVFYEM